MSAIYYELPDYGDDVLIHHGTKGMKWGVRKYQNEDGSLTDAGRRRYGDTIDTGSSRRLQKGIRRAVRSKRMQENASKYLSKDGKSSRAEKIGHHAADALDDAARLASKGSLKKAKKASADEAKSMSDADLKKAINRLQMERQYRDLSSESRNYGKKTLEDRLNTAATVVGIAASVAGIASAVYEIRKKGD